MAAIRAAGFNKPEGQCLPAGRQGLPSDRQSHKNVILLERNNCIGKKILLSGKGRCNITNIVSLDEFIAKFGRQGEFLRSAFSNFFNQDLIDFFKAKGLELKIERQGRVFPVTDRAASVIEVLNKCLLESKVKVLYNKRVSAIKKEEGLFQLFIEDGRQLSAKKTILATGGGSFGFTGSTGDGFAIAKKLGHTIVALRPGLVPLKTAETWVKELKGLTLKNIRLVFKSKGKRIISNTGELLFTHFGVSGPLVLDLSEPALGLLAQNGELILEIDLKPGLTPKQLEGRLLREFEIAGKKSIRNVLKDMLPLRLIDVFINLLGLEKEERANQLTKEKRRAIVHLFKSFGLRITGSLPLEEAMVTCGGVSTKEINPRTMESRLVQGLYFAGEIIDLSAPSGGYNLQQAFSTGYLAGREACLRQAGRPRENA